jgi:hypothetical protein
VWWVEIAILVALYYCYTGTRGFAEGSVGEATQTGETLLRWQRTMHLDIEYSLNHWLQHITVLAVVCCYYYASLHFIVTPAVLFWMHRRHGDRYSRARWALVFTTILCLIGFFLFPTAPPRLLPNGGYIDTMASFSGYGWWSATASAAPHGLDKIANLYAAMPSLHCAWALWSGLLIVRNARWLWLKVLGGLYPLCTAFVVMATANHYIVDVFAGWLVLGAGWLGAVALTLMISRRSASRRPSGPVGGYASGREGVEAIATASDARAVTIPDPAAGEPPALGSSAGLAAAGLTVPDGA